MKINFTKTLIKKNKGVTLVEIIVSIAILGIIAVSFLPTFTTGFKLISNSGNRSNSSLIAQQAMDNNIAGTGTTIANTTTTTTAGTLSITFGATTINVPGNTIVITYTNGTQNATLTTFKPN